ncbi:hypothetical protein AB0C13_00785 [Streptomyces sp. NPDC049099]|uniref:hypothetical protein n=1 Tax=Streptomyces sp. NPDC049099 TaxID=3155768 RepID=UPI00343297E9
MLKPPQWGYWCECWTEELRAESCTVAVTHAKTRITWTIRPVLFLPLARRLCGALRACGLR